MLNEKLNVLGIMSGSSLDGVDLALFNIDTSLHIKITQQLIRARTFPYPEALKIQLQEINHTSSDEYFHIENIYTDFLIDKIKEFLSDPTQCQLIGIHGHTVAHKPSDGYSIQMGNTARICEKVGIPCVSDFRNQDIAMGGQGAPMAPLVDHLLYPAFDSWLNLGGIANITTHHNAYDIGPFNQVINYLAQKVGQVFDEDGMLGEMGTLNEPLSRKLNEFPFYHTADYKSLSNKELREFFFPLLDKIDCDIPDAIHTFYLHIANKISEAIGNAQNCLISGGGAHNKYFINLLRNLNQEIHIEIPDNNTIDFKESLLIALAAQLRYFKKANYIRGITLAGKTVSAGALYIHADYGAQ